MRKELDVADVVPDVAPDAEVAGDRVASPPEPAAEVQAQQGLEEILDEFGETVVRWFVELQRRLPGTPVEQVIRQAVAKSKQVTLEVDA